MTCRLLSPCCWSLICSKAGVASTECKPGQNATELPFIRMLSRPGFRAVWSITDMIFSVRQLQKDREQGKPLYIINLTIAFDLVSRKGLFRLLEKISCSSFPQLHSIVGSFHEDM